MQTRLVRFSWNLTSLPASGGGLDDAYQVMTATPAMIHDVADVIVRAYSMEPAWSTEMTLKLEEVQALFAKWPENGIEFLGIRNGSRLIAVAGIDPVADRADHLPGGVCVLDEYRCRGIGTALLHRCLARLKERGLEKVQTEAKKGTSAERYLYSKFGAIRAEEVSPARVGA